VSARRVTTGITLVVLVIVLGGMAVYGVKSALAPLPGGSSSSKEPCSETEKEVKQYLKRSEVQVSVFNAGSRSGLAGQTLDKFEAAGFKAGNAGNAPGSAQVQRAVVWTTQPNDYSARLVAAALGRGTRIEVTETDLGPGVDVLVGNRFHGLDKKAVKQIRLPKPVETCVKVS
jgi:LytR cell envelope-related transcriptional attenuator